MSEQNVDRRSVLAAVGTVGTTALVGQVTGESGNRARVVEVERTYELPDSDRYHTFHWDQLPPYRIDEEEGRVRPVHEDDSIPEDGGVNAEGRGLGRQGRSHRLGGDERTGLITRTASRVRPAESVRLARPVTTPEVRVTVKPDRAEVAHANGRAAARANGEPASTTVDAGTVPVATLEARDELVENSEVPPARRSLKMEEGVTRVSATLHVEVRDFGELAVGPPVNR